jgi:hypothetical protein
MDHMRRAMRAGESDDDAATEREGRGSKELMRARRELKAAIAAKFDSPSEEQQRIVEILRRAMAEITGG